jgi:hypothetical protein
MPIIVPVTPRLKALAVKLAHIRNGPKVAAGLRNGFSSHCYGALGELVFSEEFGCDIDWKSYGGLDGDGGHPDCHHNGIHKSFEIKFSTHLTSPDLKFDHVNEFIADYAVLLSLGDIRADKVYIIGYIDRLSFLSKTNGIRTQQNYGNRPPREVVKYGKLFDIQDILNMIGSQWILSWKRKIHLQRLIVQGIL